MITIKELQQIIPDKILKVHTEGDVTVVTIPSGRLKIMPNHKKPGFGYSLRNGGRKTKYSLPNDGVNHPDWLLNESRIEHEYGSTNNKYGRMKKRWQK